MELREFFPFWSKLTTEQQNQLLNSARPRTLRRGAVGQTGTTECSGLFAVCTGQLRAYILSDEGREVTLYRLFPRDMCLFSASCIFSSIQFDVLIEAEKDAEVWVIPPQTYKDLMEASAPLAVFTNELMASRFSEVMWRIEQILWKSMDKRLADFLLEEAALEETNLLRLTHETIANHLGTAREVVTRLLRYFQSEGMVALSRGTIELTDEARLRALCLNP